MRKGILGLLVVFTVGAGLVVSAGNGREASAAKTDAAIDHKPEAYYSYAEKMARKILPRLPKELKPSKAEDPFRGFGYFRVREPRINQYWDFEDYRPAWVELWGKKYRYANGKPCSSMKTFRSCRILLITGANVVPIQTLGFAAYMATFRNSRPKNARPVPTLVSFEKVFDASRVTIYDRFYRCQGFLEPCG